MSDIAQLLKPLQRNVYLLLIENCNYSSDEAIKSIALHNKVFTILENERDVDAAVIAAKIHSNYQNGMSPEYWIEWVTLFQDVRDTFVKHMKMPEFKNREHEYCIKCNYPKYKDEDCRFCNC
ncbi:hypothetical protein [Paenibacillus sp. FSL H3-0333]|uniref:hypothetical protein n=1 Tax=Paenibacillus sp. FSL H3-0333 TaxID=2921373 RepID=UPI0030F8ADD8